MPPKNFPESFPVKNNGQGKKLLPEAQKKPEIGLQKLKSRHDSIKSRHDSMESRHDSMESRRDFSFILPLRRFFRGREQPLFWGLASNPRHSISAPDSHVYIK
jgi:hypothetical protein